MADGIKISQMQEKTTLEGTEFFPIVDGNSNKKVKTDKLATKDDIPSIDELLSKTEAQDLYQSKGDYALKSEIPDVEDFITETDADSKYQAKGDYALKSEIPTDYLTEDEAGNLYQTKLVSGQNIKTINGQSILGGGDITITEGGDVIDSGIPDAPNDNKLYGRKNADWSEIVMPEVPDVSEFITEAEADEKYQTKGNYALKDEIPTDYLTEETANELYQAKGDYALKSEIPNVDEFITETDADGKYATISSLDNKLDKTTYDSDKETFATKTDIDDMLTKTDAANTYQVKGEYANNSDLVYIADTVIPQMNTNTANALDKKVDWDEEKKVISLPADGSISALRNAETLEGGVLLAQRTYDEGTTYVTEVGTTKNSLTLNSTSRPKVDLQGGTSEELAYVDDLRTLPIEINIPIRSLKNQVYDQSTILGWFGVEEISDLKSLIASGGIQYLRYGISLTGNPHYYKMPVEYVAFESANQIKLVCIGLDTSDDSPVRYTIILNLDGTIASGNSNVSMVLDPISGEEVDLSSYYTKEEVDSKLKSYATVTQVQEKQDQLVSGVNIKTVNGASLLGEGDIVIETPDGGIPDAAQDGKIYGRQNGSWVEIPSLSTIDGGTFDNHTTILKENSIPTKVTDLDDSDDYATKEYVDQKVGTKISGVGVNSIQVLTELPEVQEDGVLYIVVATSA